MLVQLQPAYIPWLFDNRDAWEKSIRDQRYRYDMTFDSFMSIYNEYRGNSSGIKLPSISYNTPVSSTPSSPIPSASNSAAGSASAGAGQLLSQSEIDDLIAAMAG